jgi:hypothetical protein
MNHENGNLPIRRIHLIDYLSTIANIFAPVSANPKAGHVTAPVIFPDKDL